ncbi:MAG: hypothetical protein ACE5GX_18475 [Thermoanaerobaculia bacterium]
MRNYTCMAFISRRRGDGLLIWMDMLENGEVSFQTTYELVRAD